MRKSLFDLLFQVDIGYLDSHVSSATMATSRLLSMLPKIELHTHFDGALCNNLLFDHLTNPSSLPRPSIPTTTNLPWKPDSPFPVAATLNNAKTLNSFNSICTCSSHRSLISMLECFELFTPIIRGNLALLEANALEFVRKQHDNNVIYTEVRYSPHFLATENSDPRPVVDAITRGFEKGVEQFPDIHIKQILCCLCFRPEWASAVVDMCEEYRNNSPCEVVGIDIAAGEEHVSFIPSPLRIRLRLRLRSVRLVTEGRVKSD